LILDRGNAVIVALPMLMEDICNVPCVLLIVDHEEVCELIFIYQV